LTRCDDSGVVDGGLRPQKLLGMAENKISERIMPYILLNSQILNI
jgi:hypothetical protein